MLDEQPLIVPYGKYQGSVIAGLPLLDLKEALQGCSRADPWLLAALRDERCRRWHDAHPVGLARRQQSAERRGGRKQ
jgi:hypothetical protein